MSRLKWIVLAILLLAPAASAQPPDTTNFSKPLVDVYSKALVENWVQFGGGFHQVYFYLPRTIRTTPRGTKTVWGVNVQSMSGADTLATDVSESRAAILKHREEAHFPPEKLNKYATYLLTKLQWEVD